VNKVAKQNTVEKFKLLFTESDIVILAHNKGGLKVSDDRLIRSSMRKDGVGKYFVGKNSLMRLAVKQTKHSSLDHLFKGPVSIACGSDPISVSKIFMNFCNAEDSKLQVIGGSIDGNEVSVAHIKMLSSLPTLNEARSQILALMKEPMSRLVRVFSSYTEGK
jgi:large subunit ribosomal protein L10